MKASIISKVLKHGVWNPDSWRC